jgi:hypothetical protein
MALTHILEVIFFFGVVLTNMCILYIIVFSFGESNSGYYGIWLSLGYVA